MAGDDPMTATITEIDPLELEMLDFKILCTQADYHPDGGLHDGSSEAAYYVRGFCSGCSEEFGVWPVCAAYVDALYSPYIHYWGHSCGAVNNMKETVVVVSSV